MSTQEASVTNKSLQAAELLYLSRQLGAYARERELRMDRELAKARKASEERALKRQQQESGVKS